MNRAKTWVLLVLSAIGVWADGLSVAVASDAGPSQADFARLQAEVARLQQEVRDQKQLILNVMQAEQQRYDILLQLLRGTSAQAPTPQEPPSRPSQLDASPGRAPSRALAVSGPPAPDAAADVGTVTGRVTLPAGTRDAYVYVDGLRPTGRERSRTVEIKQKDKRFSPDTLAVPVGTRVVFPNLDPFYHNVFSMSAGNSFDAGSTKGGGVSQPVVLSKPGHIEIFCNLHRRMRADVLVTPNGYFARVDRDGDFQLVGVPVGSRTIVLWGPQIKTASQHVDLTSHGATMHFTAEAESQKPHLNKSGQVYGSYDE
jgi:plastocyanin